MSLIDGSFSVQEIYEPISEESEGHFAFIKIFNAGEKYVIHKHEGYLQSKVSYDNQIMGGSPYCRVFDCHSNVLL